jgi:FixJ family two-component response regulator
LSDSNIISIIDDDDSVRVAVARLVRSLGWRTHTFASATEFLQSPHLKDTCCLVTDVQMPSVNGLELQRRLIAQDYHIPIIFMTAFPGQTVRARAMAEGAIGFLVKPLDATTLSECIAAAMRRERQD